MKTAQAAAIVLLLSSCEPSADCPLIAGPREYVTCVSGLDRTFQCENSLIEISGEPIELLASEHGSCCTKVQATARDSIVMSAYIMNNTRCSTLVKLPVIDECGASPGCIIMVYVNVGTCENHVSIGCGWVKSP